MNINKLNELLLKVKAVTTIEDIAYHKFENGGLCPIHKLETAHLQAAHWKKSHNQLAVKIEDDWVLQTVVNEKRTVYLNNIDRVNNAPAALIHFGVKTILIIPIVIDDIVVGMLDIVSIGKVVDLTDAQIKACEILALELNKIMQQSN